MPLRYPSGVFFCTKHGTAEKTISAVCVYSVLSVKYQKDLSNTSKSCLPLSPSGASDLGLRMADVPLA